jgi:hypothetical protein
MTLGCGGYGGNITSDNISPRHLLNIKRLAYEITPVASRFERTPSGRSDASRPAVRTEGVSQLGITAEALNRRIEAFLGSRGYRPTASAGGSSGRPAAASETTEKDQRALDFVCEDDVRKAVQSGRKLVVAERAIITPAARELGEQHRVFTPPTWKG